MTHGMERNSNIVYDHGLVIISVFIFKEIFHKPIAGKVPSERSRKHELFKPYFIKLKSVRIKDVVL